MAVAEDAIRPLPTCAVPARLESRAGRRWWLCPNCEAKLGEVVGGRVVILVGDRRITMPARNEPEQGCPRCGEASALRAADERRGDHAA